MSQKGSANIVLILVIVVVVAFGGYFVMPGKSTSPTPQLSVSTDKDIDLAEQALITYFSLLKTKQYEAAVEYHGSGYEALQNWNPAINSSDHAALLQSGCEVNGLVCSKIKNVLSQQQISQSEFKFIVQFEKSEWSTGSETVFAQGPCCGEEDTGQRKTNFEYVVKKTDGNFVVAIPPIYVP